MSDGELGTLVVKLGADLTDLKKGLLEGKAQLAGFQQVVESAGRKVKEALAFAGISVGLYELFSQLKQFGASILDVGGKSEILRASMYALGQHYQMSGQALDYYVQQLKAAGIEQERSLQAINSFLKAGISVDYLPQLAQAAKVLGASMGLPMQEAFSSLVTGIVKSTPKQLAEMVPGIREVLQSMSSETKKLLDTSIISGTEKSEILLSAVLAMADKAKGVVDTVSDSYFAKLNEYKVKVAEVKEALFEFVKPIALAVTGAEIKTWEDLYGAIGNNKQALRDLGETMAVYVGRLAGFIRAVAEFGAAHKDLALALLEVWGAMKVLKWFTIAEGAGVAAVAVGGLTGKLAALRLALAGPWGLIITVTLVGLMEALKGLDKLSKGKARAQALAGEAYNLMTPKQRAEIDRLNKETVEDFSGYEQPLPEEAWKYISSDEAARRARAAAKMGKSEHELTGGKKGGGAEEDLLGEHLKMLEARRHADLAAAEEEIKVLKGTLEAKKVALEKDLAEGLIDGQTYYSRLQEMQSHRNRCGPGPDPAETPGPGTGLSGGIAGPGQPECGAGGGRRPPPGPGRQKLAGNGQAERRGGAAAVGRREEDNRRTEAPGGDQAEISGADRRLAHRNGPAPGGHLGAGGPGSQSHPGIWPQKGRGHQGRWGLSGIFPGPGGKLPGQGGGGGLW